MANHPVTLCQTLAPDLLLKSHHLEYHRIMEALKFTLYLVALPVAYVLLVEIIDRMGRK